MSSKQKIAIIGSGNWGTTAGLLCAENAKMKMQTFYHKEIRMYVYQELINGQKLTDIINDTHENVKYLPGFKLPKEIVAYDDLGVTVEDADLIVFCLPHQFIKSIIQGLKESGKIKSSARAISLIKGIHVEKGEVRLLSKLIESELGIECGVLMGANVATDVAKREFAETTIACRSPMSGQLFNELFDSPTFSVRVIHDVEGAELIGAVKNIVALGAGFCDGLGLGSNTKSAIIRIGFFEILKFAQMLFPTVSPMTFFESCGVADLFTTCIGGRNRKCAAYFAKTGESWEKIEKKLLNGQKLQGTDTCKQVMEVLEARKVVHLFPFFHKVYKISFQDADPLSLTHWSINSRL